MFRGRSVSILISLAIVLLASLAIYINPPFLSEILIKLENESYDEEIRTYHKSTFLNNPIVIVDIDDKSMSAEGRWPWNRKKIGHLLEELHRLGASVVVFDLVFSEPSENPVEVILNSGLAPEIQDGLQKIRSEFDADAVFAKALSKGKNCLGFVLARSSEKIGDLPDPIFILSESDAKESTIMNWKGWLGNLSSFQSAAKNSGSLNSTIDADGILRSSPLIVRNGTKIYPSLALKAAEIFLSLPISRINTEQTKDKVITRSVSLGDIKIPTDPWGRILVPFRGPAFSFPYLSATDLLHGKITEDKVRGKLIFIGSSATATGDLVSTAISSVYPGVEVHATIALGIIDRYLPYKPIWGKDAAAFFLLIVGLVATFIFPCLGHLGSFIFFICAIILLKAFNRFVWFRYGIPLSFFLPVPTVTLLFLIDLIATFFAKHKKSAEENKK